MTFHLSPATEQQRVYQRGDVAIHFAPAEELYATWPTPTCIIVDGPYGVNGYPGDLLSIQGLVEWYEPHVKAWAAYATAGNYTVVLEH